MILGAIGAALAMIVGGGAFAAYQLLSGGGPQPSDALPSSALAYTRIDLDPSASQKVNAFRLLRRVPEFEESTGISSDTEDLRELMFDSTVGQLDCGLSYEDDVEPWIGDRAGLAMVPVNDRLTGVAAIQVSDQQAAEDAVAAIEECGVQAPGLEGFDTEIDVAAASGTGPLVSSAVAADEDTGQVEVDFVGDYMLIADTPDDLPEIVEEAESSPLSDNERFSADMEALDGEGLASFWFDVDGLREQPTVVDQLGDEAMVAYEQVHSAFGAVRAGSDYIELVGQATTDTELPSTGDNPITELPDSTLMALSASGGSAWIDEYWDSFQSGIESFGGPGAYDEMVADVESESGLRLPDDLRTILGDNITLAMDSTGLTPETIESEDPSAFYFGARLTTDQAAIQDVVDRVNAKLAEEGMPEGLITKETDDGLVAASNEDYAEMLAAGGDLGSSDGFETAVPDASEASMVFYLDFDRLTDAMAQDDSVDDDDLATIEPMRSLGAGVTQVDDGQRMTMRLVFD